MYIYDAYNMYVYLYILYTYVSINQHCTHTQTHIFLQNVLRAIYYNNIYVYVYQLYIYIPIRGNISIYLRVYI